MTLESKAFRCDCASPEHIIIVDKDYDFNDPFLAFYIKLNPIHPWYKRLWYAIRYVFNCGENTWDFVDVLLRDDKIQELVEFLQAYLDRKNLK